MRTKEDVAAHINKIEKRYKEAQRVLKYLEKADAPAPRLKEMKRIVNFLEQEHNTQKLAFALTELALKSSTDTE
ncbi:hypothetical protein [Heyndrickxia coagulans]|uniref:Uncharacterized protein n=1 Tax=Heyndrickxia coagulans TaxID=1398 RepID=A0A150KHF2_HEYCO|nr:hypothetical protein [Heyndrickxia coagulans]KYC71569.1 hypothetical protein B4099_3693 [Heyndrickxia coagulans]